MSDTHHHHKCPPRSKSTLFDLEEKLRMGSKRLTGGRLKLLRFLNTQDHPLTIKEIFSAMDSGEMDLVTVYRSMSMLEGMGLVKRYDFGDAVARFELTGEGQHDHHHHLICIRCDTVVEIEECFPPDLENAISRQNGFTAVTHKLEFFGVCPKCQ
jgi:Fur family ferric uptake transcriptional regulator